MKSTLLYCVTICSALNSYLQLGPGIPGSGPTQGSPNMLMVLYMDYQHQDLPFDDSGALTVLTTGAHAPLNSGVTLMVNKVNSYLIMYYDRNTFTPGFRGNDTLFASNFDANYTAKPILTRIYSGYMNFHNRMVTKKITGWNTHHRVVEDGRLKLPRHSRRFGGLQEREVTVLNMYRGYAYFVYAFKPICFDVSQVNWYPRVYFKAVYFRTDLEAQRLYDIVRHNSGATTNLGIAFVSTTGVCADMASTTDASLTSEESPKFKLNADSAGTDAFTVCQNKVF